MTCKKFMGNCGCGHCDCDDEQAEKTPEEKVKDLEKEIADLGYKVEETTDGEMDLRPGAQAHVHGGGHAAAG